MDEIYLLKNKSKNKINKKRLNNIYFKILLYKFLITFSLVLMTLIIIRDNDKYKAIIKHNVYEKNFSFAQINNWYNKYLGSILPFREFKLFKEEVKTTFSEKLKYKEINKYNDGIKLTVDKNYLVPIQESGMVVFTGEKEEYGNIVIIQQINGVDLWYGNLNTVEVKLYDYVEKGKLLGETKGNELYLVYQKEGQFVDYKEYLEES